MPDPKPSKPGLHPRNPHRAGYDFPALVEAAPELRAFLTRTPDGRTSLDFAEPQAVKVLNRALLLHHYGVRGWDLPEGALCPPVPGRADYVHHLADLLGEALGGTLLSGPGVRILDLGTGASGIYALLGHRAYGWSCVGTDVDPRAMDSVRRILAANPGLEAGFELRRQNRPDHVLEGVLKPGERFHASLCNPPFHASAAEAREGSARKWRNLKGVATSEPARNFGGRGGELWCPGGEAAFVGRMVEESVTFADRILWFTSLVSRSENLPGLKRKLRAARAAEVRIIPMAQGQKRSRILAWTFVPTEARRGWFEGP
ncbi:MAG: 23S rRNA (adenine(1618)-N(6))-methyltransferase RlmF [Holophagaceae bacterium]